MKHLLFIIFLALLFIGCKSPEARMPESVQSGSFLKESAERNIKLNQKEQKEIKAIIAKNSEIDYLASESGFWYYYNNKVEKDTIQPEFGDIINFNYNVSRLNGSEVYSEEEIGTRTYVMDKEELFTGLREGLKLMKPSETVTFIFPSQKAFGYYGDEKRIGTNIPLICEVTLNSITKNND